MRIWYEMKEKYQDELMGYEKDEDEENDKDNKEKESDKDDEFNLEDNKVLDVPPTLISFAVSLSNVDNICGMFCGCKSLSYIPQSLHVPNLFPLLSHSIPLSFHLSTFFFP